MQKSGDVAGKKRLPLAKTDGICDGFILSSDPMKRRRKTRSAHAKSHRSLWAGLLAGFAIFMVSAVVAVFCFFAYVNHFVRSEAFRELVREKASRAMKAESEMATVRWEGTNGYVERFEAQGFEDAAFSKATVSGLRAQFDLSARHFREGVWKIPEITVSQMDLVFGKDGRLPGTSLEALAVHGEIPGEPAAEEERDEGGGGLLDRLLPRRLVLDEARINNLNLTFREDRETAVVAQGIQTWIRPSAARESVRILAKGGAIRSRNLPELQVNLLDLQWAGNRFFVNEGQLSTDGGARATFDGEIELGRDGEPGELLVQLDLTNLDLEDLVAGTWKRRLQGDLEVEATIEGAPENLAECRQTGVVTLNRGMIESLPVLDMLARYTNSERFRRIALRDGARAEFTRKGDRLEIRNIEVQSDGLARLTGEIDVEGGNLSGYLDLGVIPGTLKWIPVAERVLFRDARDGHVWTRVTVGGTVERPEHDLDDQLIAAGLEAGREALVRQLDDLANDPGQSAETVEEVLNFGRDLLRSFFP